MIDIRAARHAPDEYRAAVARKGAADLFDELMATDARVLAAADWACPSAEEEGVAHVIEAYLDSAP